MKQVLLIGIGLALGMVLNYDKLSPESRLAFGTCWPQWNTTSPAERMERLLMESADLREVHAEWKKKLQDHPE
jgi:hypothetical protein